MINYITEKRVTRIAYKESITCDICKKTYRYDDDMNDIQEFFHINQCGGYGSIFGDGVYIKMDICQHCMKNIIEKFNINVQYENMGDYDYEEYYN